jgi:hypothetical protein
MRLTCQRTSTPPHKVATRSSSMTGFASLRPFDRSGVLTACVLTVICATTQTARAEPDVLTQGHADSKSSSDYDSVLDQAVGAFESRDYLRARTLFEQAYTLRPNARVLRGLGIAALQLKRYTAAKRELEAALLDTVQPLTAPQRQGVTQLITWMSANLGTLRLHVAPEQSEVRIDNESSIDTEVTLSPGSHRVSVSAKGFNPEERSVHVTAGQVSSLTFVLSPHVPEPAARVAALTAPSNSAAIPTPSTTSARDTSPSDSTVFEQWWFWTAVGVVVAGGVATTVALTHKPEPKPFESGGLGTVLMPLVRVP